MQGALELIDTLAHALLTLTGMSAVAMSPKAGAHGEFCGMMAIKAALAARGEDKTRTVVLVPDSAHGTNPATAALIGFSVRAVPADADGVVSAEAVRAALGARRRRDHAHQSQHLRAVRARDRRDRRGGARGGRLFLLRRRRISTRSMGKTRPGDLGVDAMHINLHKTFSTPHGGGGPGAGPVVLSERLAPFAPVAVDRQERPTAVARRTRRRDARRSAG